MLQSSLSFYHGICKYPFQTCMRSSLSLPLFLVIPSHSPFLCNSIVCQVAGNLRGQMPGDLGEVGTGSLSYKTMNNLLDVLLQSLVAQPITSTGKISTSHIAQVVLTARLLACAQRKYLLYNEWNEHNYELQTVLSAVQNQTEKSGIPAVDRADDLHPICCPKTLLESPVVNHLFRHISPFVTNNTTARTIRTEDDTPLSQEDNEDRSNESERVVNSWKTVLAMSAGNEFPNEKTLIAVLQVLCAAVELHPLGACWASSAQNNWTLNSGIGECLSASETFISLFGCSSCDLAFVVDTVCSILETYGGFNASSEIQEWTLICLSKLSIATELHSISFPDVTDSLQIAWRKVWIILFSSDMCYAARTKVTLSGSIGDLVVRLLTQMVRFSCTDLSHRSEAYRRDSFLVNNQGEIWNLPAFVRCERNNLSVLVLMYAFLERLGLRDGNDSIGSTMYDTEGWQRRIQEYGGGRRSRLACYCLCFVDLLLDGQKNEALVSILSTCLAALVTNFSVPISSVISLTSDDRLHLTLGLFDDFEFFRVCDDYTKASEVLRKDLNKCDELCQCLWSPPLVSSEGYGTLFRGDAVDIIHCGLQNLFSNASSRERMRQSGNTTLSTDKTSLFKCVISSIQSIVECSVEESESPSATSPSLCDGDKGDAGRRTALKIYSTVFLSAHPDDIKLGFGRFATCLSSVLEQSSKRMTSTNDNDSLASLLADVVCLVRGLTFANSSLGFVWPGHFVSIAKALCSICTGLIDNARTDYSNTSPLRKATFDDLFIDDDAGDSVRNRKSGNPKRPLHILHSRQKRSRLSEKRKTLFSQDCSFLTCAILIALNPTTGNCELVAKFLLGLNIVGEQGRNEYEVDVKGGIFAVNLLCTQQIVSGHTLLHSTTTHQFDSENASIVSLICKLIRSIRLAAKPYSDAFLFGNIVCSTIVILRDKNYWSADLSATETKALIDLLTFADSSNDRRNLAWRQSLRSTQLFAATHAFKNGSESVHDKLDGLFGGTLVLPFLSDINGTVRSRALASMAAALLILAEDKVIQSVKDHLPPVTTVSPGSDGKSSYRRWSARKCLATAQDECPPEVETQIWDDAYVCLLRDVVTCWCVIAETSSNREVLQQVLFDLVKLAFMRPGLEGLCFLSLERIAFLKGFGKVENLLDAELRDMSRRWLETEESLFDIPLMITSPSTFRCLIRGGQLQLLSSDTRNQDQASKSAVSVVRQIRYVAATEFLLRRTNDIVPRIVISSVTTLIQASVTKEGRRRLLENHSLKEYCSIQSEAFDDDIALKTLRAIVPSIIADLLVIRCISDDMDPADSIDTLLRGLLTDDVVQRQSEDGAWLVLRRFIELVGEDSTMTTTDAYAVSVRKFLYSIGKKSKINDNSPFVGVSCSAIEFLSFAKLHMDSSVVPCQIGQRWRAVNTVLQVLMADMNCVDQSQTYSFCIHTLLNVVHDERFTSVKVSALRLLHELVQLALKIDARQTVADMKTLLGAVFELHKACQNDIEQTCNQLQRDRDKLMRYGCGVPCGNESNGELSDYWGWTSDKDRNSHDVPWSVLWGYCSKYVSDLMIDCLTTTFDIVQEILSISASLHLGCEVVSSLLFDSRDTFSALADVDTKFSAQKLIAEFLQNNRPNSSDEAYTENLFTFISTKGHSNQVFVRAEMAAMERFLHLERFRRTEPTVLVSDNLENVDAYSALKKTCLSKLSASEIRVAASRCLGEIHLTPNIANILEQSNDTSLVDDFLGCPSSGSIRKSLNTKIIESLANALHSPQSYVALVAIDTLKALFSTRVGKDSLSALTDLVVVATVEPIALSAPARLRSEMLLSSCEINQLYVSHIHGSDNHEWCWSDSLWLWRPSSKESTSYETWLCRLVPALLICCYGNRDSPLRKDKFASFFAFCQRMCCVDPTVAEAVFPAVVLDLLLREDSNESKCNVDPVRADTWIGRSDSTMNIRLSHSFGTLLEENAGDFDHRIVELAVDTLDMLRRITLSKFQLSPNHKRNRMSNKSEKTLEPYTSSLWPGIPFGIVLAIDGILVAKACFRARRFQTALYYAEFFADSVFGGSNCTQETLSLEKEKRIQRLLEVAMKNISGFGGRLSSISELEPNCFDFLKLFGSCYADLQEEDCCEAVQHMVADLDFVSGKDTRSTAQQFGRGSLSLQHLQSLDGLLLLGNGSISTQLSVMECLESLGLRGVLECYVLGLPALKDISTFAETDKNEIRENLFRCRLYAMQWNDNLFQPEMSTSDDRTSTFTGVASFARDRTCNGGWEGSFLAEPYSEPGFHELVVSALLELRRNDNATSLNQFRKARLRFLDVLSSGTGRVTQFKSVDFISILQVLNDMEHLIAPLEPGEGLRTRLEKFSILSKSDNMGTIHSLSVCVREVSMRILSNDSSLPRKFIVDLNFSHLLRQFESNLLDNRHNEANNVLRRLHSVASSHGDRQCLFLTGIRLRMLEARLSEARGDISEAVRVAKLTIKVLDQKNERNREEDIALADVLYLCGKWAMKHNVEPANSILDNYLQPAANLSKAIHCSQANILNSNRATTALLLQGLLASNIFDTVSNRICSLEWQTSETSLIDREKEMKSLDTPIIDFKMRLSDLLKKKQTVKATILKKELDEMLIFQLHLRKEIEATRIHRHSILQSMDVHRLLAMRSIVTALSIAGTSGADDILTNVYRLVAMWFTSEDTWTKCVDSNMSEAIIKIPSFRFVPLASQLFSRIAKNFSNLDSFQNRLQELVRKVSLQHPYHCLLQLISLSAQGSAEPSSDKAKAADSILLDLCKIDTRFVAELIESHKKLADAYVHLALADTSEYSRGANNCFSFDAICKTNALRLDRCLGLGSRKVWFPPCIFTQPPFLRPDYDYGNGLDDPIGSERIESFEGTFSITETGLNQPKIVVCIGTRKGRYKQLVKGNDDTRQDAVMEQVFGFVNELMSRRRQRNTPPHLLRLVTYNILPLTFRAGVG